jgi:DNA-binding transcriptional regulator YdaS (Cro superfamily)
MTRNLLDQYLRRNALTRDAFARLVGTTGPVVSRWASGARIPSLTFATRVDQVTGGAVPLSYWVQATRRRAA